MRKLVFVSMFFSLVLPAWGNTRTPLVDPEIPDGETAVYLSREDDRESFFTERVEVRMENGSVIYSIVTESESETTEVKIQKTSMIPFSVFTVTKSDAATVESSTNVSIHIDIQTEDIIVLSFSDLRYTLRGFPFGEGAPDLGIAFLNSDEEEDEGPRFDIKISYIEIEEVEAAGRSIPSHKIELKLKASGIMRVLNSFIGKTYFWYSVEKPHYLVAYEGNSSFPGSPKVHVKIADYSGWK